MHAMTFSSVIRIFLSIKSRLIILPARLAVIPDSTDNFNPFIDQIIANHWPRFPFIEFALFIAGKRFVVMAYRSGHHTHAGSHLAVSMSRRMGFPSYGRT